MERKTLKGDISRLNNKKARKGDLKKKKVLFLVFPANDSSHLLFHVCSLPRNSKFQLIFFTALLEFILLLMKACLKSVGRINGCT